MVQVDTERVMLVTALQRAGTLVAGFLMRPCCSMPAALAVTGAGGAGVAATVAEYRLWFMLAATLLLGVSFYWNFIRNRNRVGMAVWAVSALVALTLVLPGCKENEPMEAEQSHSQYMETSDMQTIQIPVKGMACEACSRRLEGALNEAEGVAEASVDLKAEQASVRYDPQRLELQALGELIRKTGFQPELDHVNENL